MKYYSSPVRQTKPLSWVLLLKTAVNYVSYQISFNRFLNGKNLYYDRFVISDLLTTVANKV